MSVNLPPSSGGSPNAGGNVEGGKAQEAKPEEELQGKLNMAQFQQLAQCIQKGLVADVLSDAAGELEEPEETEDPDEESSETKDADGNTKAKLPGNPKAQSRVSQRQAGQQEKTGEKKEAGESKSESSVKNAGTQKQASSAKTSPHEQAQKSKEGQSTPKKESASTTRSQGELGKTQKQETPKEQLQKQVPTGKEAQTAKSAPQQSEKGAQAKPSSQTKEQSQAQTQNAPRASKEQAQQSTKGAANQGQAQNLKESKEPQQSSKAAKSQPKGKEAEARVANLQQGNQAQKQTGVKNQQNVQKQAGAEKVKPEAKEETAKASQDPAQQAKNAAQTQKARASDPAQKGSEAQETQSGKSDDADNAKEASKGAQLQHSDVKKEESSKKAKEKESEGLGLKQSQVVSGSSDKDSDAGGDSDHSPDTSSIDDDDDVDAEREEKNEDKKEESSKKGKEAESVGLSTTQVVSGSSSKDSGAGDGEGEQHHHDSDEHEVDGDSDNEALVHHSWSNEYAGESLDDEVESFHDVQPKTSKASQGFSLLGEVQDKQVSALGSSDSSSGQGFHLFSDDYKMHTGDTLDAQVAANMATYKSNKEKSDWDTKQHLLENLAQEYAGFVNDYMGAVRGYGLHIFDGTYHFTNDMTPNNPTGKYEKYLKQVQEYEDDYLQAKSQLWDFDPVYTAAQANYTALFDEYQLVVNVETAIQKGIKGVNYSALESAIKHAEADGLSQESAINKAIDAMENEISSEINNLNSKIADGKADANDTNTLNTLEALEADLRTYKSDLDGLFSKSSIVSSSQVSNDLTKINQNLDALKGEDPSLASSLNSKLFGAGDSVQNELNKYNADVNTVKTDVAQLKTNISAFYKSVMPLIESALRKVEADDKAFGSVVSFKPSSLYSTGGVVHSVIDPFRNISSLFGSLEDQMEHIHGESNFLGMISSLSSFNQGISSTLNNMNSTLLTEMLSAQVSWVSAQNTMKTLKENVANTSSQYYNYMKNDEVPVGQRYSSVSDYGYAMDALASYKRIAACVDLTGADFDQLSRTVYRKPDKVNAALIPEWWKTKNNFYKMYEKYKAELPAAIAAAAAAAAYAASCCGTNGWADAMAAAAAAAVIFIKKEEASAYSSYLGALQVYDQYAHSLPAMQSNKDKIWKKKIGTESAKIATDIEKKTEETIKENKEAEEKEKQEASNIEKTLKIITGIVSQSKKAAKTQSYLS